MEHWTVWNTISVGKPTPAFDFCLFSECVYTSSNSHPPSLPALAAAPGANQHFGNSGGFGAAIRSADYKQGASTHRFVGIQLRTTTKFNGST